MLQHRQLRLVTTLAAIVLALPVCANASSPKVTTTLRVAVTGAFFLHANMAGVSGIGRTSGQHFVLNGSENFEADGDIPNTLNLQGTYRLTPVPPPISQAPARRRSCRLTSPCRWTRTVSPQAR